MPWEAQTIYGGPQMGLSFKKCKRLCIPVGERGPKGHWVSWQLLMVTCASVSQASWGSGAVGRWGEKEGISRQGLWADGMCALGSWSQHTSVGSVVHRCHHVFIGNTHPLLFLRGWGHGSVDKPSVKSWVLSLGSQ